MGGTDPKAPGRTMLLNPHTLNYRRFWLLSEWTQILFQVQCCGEGDLA